MFLNISVLSPSNIYVKHVNTLTKEVCFTPIFYLHITQFNMKACALLDVWFIHEHVAPKAQLATSVWFKESQVDLSNSA